MCAINLPGISTGIDTKKIIDQLMAVNQRKLSTYMNRQKELMEKKSAFTSLRSQVQKLSSAINEVSSVENLRSFDTSSSDDDVVTIETSGRASDGSHTVTVKQLATAETWIHDANSFEYKTDFVGGGNFIYTYNNQQRIINTIYQ